MNQHTTHLSSQWQCMIVLTLQFMRPYLVSNPEIQKGQAESCRRQHLSVVVNIPTSVYLDALLPLPHHFVPGILMKSPRSLLLLLLLLTTPSTTLKHLTTLTTYSFQYGSDRIELMKTENRCLWHLYYLEPTQF